VPTSAPAAGGDAAWNKVQQAGKIVVGTSADYAPFEFYTPEAKLDGFDIALMKAIGQKLGVEVEFNDFAFEGLGGALPGPGGCGIAAVSVTPQRLAVVDFSNVYYVSSDAMLAPADATFTISSLADAANKRIGVQAGTVYEAMLNNNVAFDAGSGGSWSYQVPTNDRGAVRSTWLCWAKNSSNCCSNGGLKLVASDFSRQCTPSRCRRRDDPAQASASPDGAADRRALAKLSKQYLMDAEAVAQPLPDMTPEPPAQAPACVDGMAFVQDLSYDDHNLTQLPTVQPGTAFTRSWRVQNSGTCTWGTNYFLVFNHGNNLLAQMASR
jgi:hypothetical protein